MDYSIFNVRALEGGAGGGGGGPRLIVSSEDFCGV